MTVCKIELRQKILAEVSKLENLDKDNSKDFYRSLHVPAVLTELEKHQEWIRNAYSEYEHFFADGDEICPESIEPVLIEVTEKWHADLFRLVRFTWSLPSTKGYGRRLRFILIDNSVGKVIGVLGLQSPPLDFPARDRLISYPADRKIELINQTMDLFTVGAIAPYTFLLGGKLVALAAASNEVRLAYERKYAGRVTIIDKRKLPSHLVGLTTTSSFGRSSMYNRLKYHDRLIAKSLGYTEGYGSFHLATVYPLLREFLEEQGISTSGGFGRGPRVVWQTCTRAFDQLNLPRSLLKHGIQREVFLFPLARNFQDYMEGRIVQPEFYKQSFFDLAEWWRERWMLSRAERVKSWSKWDSTKIGCALLTNKTEEQ